MNDLEQRLLDLGEHLDVPAGDGLAAAVVARIRGDRRPSGLRRPWRWLVGGAIALVAGVGVSPAVSDLLGVGGVAVRQEAVPTPSTVAPSATPPSMPPLDLGRPTRLEAVHGAAGFAPVLPTALGEPREVFVDDRGHVPIVWLHWDDALVTELAAGMPSMPVLQKFAPDAEIRWVRAGARPALWIGGTHEIVVAEVEGTMIVERLRSADSALLFELGTLTIRIETAAGLDEALRIAASMHGT